MRFFNVCNQTNFSLHNTSGVRDLGGSAECARRRIVAIRFRNAGTKPDARPVHPREHFDAARKFDDTIHSSGRKFYEPANAGQQHDAFHGKSEHESWEQSHRFAMRNFAGHARRNGRVY